MAPRAAVVYGAQGQSGPGPTVRRERSILAAALLAAMPPAPAQADDDVSIALHANIQLDAVALQSSNLPPADHISSGGGFRRIRIGVSGRLSQDWAYEITPKLESSSSNHIAISNLFLQYDGLAPVHVRVGAYGAPANFDGATSSTDLLFLERAQPADLGRNIGAGTGRAGASVFAYDESYFAALSYTGAPANAAIFSQQAVVGRLVWRPIHDEDGSFAFGADLTHVFTLPGTGGAHDFRLRERPELNVQTVDLRLIDTGNLDSDSVTAFDVEATGNRGNLYAQGGFFHYAIARAAPITDDPAFSGWYLQASWVLTGEAKPWRSNKGGYGAPTIAHPLGEGGLGALELAARYSDLDLDYRPGAPDTAAKPEAVRGGRQRIVTVGLNWYPAGPVRFLLDYNRVEAARLSVNGQGCDASADLVSLRSQVSF